MRRRKNRDGNYYEVLIGKNIFINLTKVHCETEFHANPVNPTQTLKQQQQVDFQIPINLLNSNEFFTEP